MLVIENLKTIMTQITEACERTHRNPNDIKIIAVTKYVSVERAKEALQAGIKHIGENRDDGLVTKREILGVQPNWHFIGSLQSRKVKYIIDKVDYIHSLDRISLAKEIQKRSTKTIKCFIQVNVSGEETKQGISPDELFDFVGKLTDFPSIEVVGLMTMAPFCQDETIIRNCFRSLCLLQKKVQAMRLDYAPCTELSMGMSNDFQIAIEEGATFIRLGSSLVGNDF